ncbi:MAG: hypothetical protein JW940_14030 [Polyangiaceae bacterium]|nr:hypothetical protein [Polyangiaceae bacterium]
MPTDWTYMRRDHLMTGTQHGAIDFEWLIQNLEVGAVPYGVDEDSLGSIETFVLGAKAVHAAEGYVLSLFQLYPTVYFHKATRGAEKLFVELLARVLKLLEDGSISETGLPSSHPIARFAAKPDVVENLLALDDALVSGTLPLLKNSSDALVSEFAGRLLDRRLYKCIDVRVRVASAAGLADVEVDRVCEAIRTRVDERMAEGAGRSPTILLDQASRAPYKTFQDSKGPLNQIRVRTDDGSLVDLEQRSAVVRAIQPFTLFRLFYADDDAKRFIEQTIQQEIDHGRAS